MNEKIHNPDQVFEALCALFPFDNTTTESIIHTPQILGEEADSRASIENIVQDKKYIQGALKGAIIAAETTPANGFLRYVLCYGSTLAATNNSVISAGVLGASTLLLEGGASIAASSALTSEKGSRAINIINRGLENKYIKKFIPVDKKINPPAEAVIGLYAGTSILQTLKQREKPERSKKELRNIGLRTTAWLTPVCTVQGYAMAEGITNLSEPKVVIPSVLVIGGMVAVAQNLKNKIVRKNQVLQGVAI